MAIFNPYPRTLKSLFQNPRFYSRISFTQTPTSQNRSVYNSAIQFILNEAQEFQSSKTQCNYPLQKEEEELSPQKQQRDLSDIKISHPWREWVDLMERLLKNGYFDEIGNPFANNGESGNKEANSIRTACLNFARDNYQLIRYLSREDIQVIAGSGCPSTDRKVVNSGKRLRAHVGLNEGNVCSSCILRGDCDRAYVTARVDEGGRTVDVMRLLLTYGLDPKIGSVENKPCLNKRVKESVRTLLKEIVNVRIKGHDGEPPKAITHEQTSSMTSSKQENDVDQVKSQTNVPMKQGDWICPKCNFMNFARNIKCLRCNGFFKERMKQLAEEQQQLPLKKGDWICGKCECLNFARNTRCFMCEEKPPKRRLNPGEWECDSCNYINFRRNMVCLKCDHRRQIASNGADITSQPVNSSVKKYPQEKQSRHECVDSLKFVESESQDHISSSSLNRSTGFMDFPVVGGKSDLSRNVQKQELWKMEMAAKSRTVDRARDDTREDTRKDSGRHNSYIFRGTSKNLASDDDDMAEWFGGRKRCDNEHRIPTK
ncbi:hypothetical protein ACS0TY_011422 [Phlomoides rotata]